MLRLSVPGLLLREEMTGLCRVVPNCHDVLRDLVLMNENYHVRQNAMRTLMTADFQGELPFLLDNGLPAGLATQLLVDTTDGLVDCGSRCLLFEYIRDEKEECFITAVRFLTKVADDDYTVQFGRTMLRERKLSEDETVAELGLISEAAYYTNNTTVVDELQEYVEQSSQRLRLPSLIFLTRVPGTRADRLLEAELSRIEGEFSPIVRDQLRFARQDAMDIRTTTAPGWRSVRERGACHGFWRAR